MAPPLAQRGHVATAALSAVPNPITRLIGAIFDLRSQGVKNLRSAPLLAAADHAGPPPAPGRALAHER